jgi:hypothetical protein
VARMSSNTALMRGSFSGLGGGFCVLMRHCAPERGAAAQKVDESANSYYLYSILFI